MKLIDQVEEYAKRKLQQKPTIDYPYHNLQHTLGVVDHAREIGQYLQLSHDQMQVVLISAWFHDIGYTSDYMNHEEAGVEISDDFLDSHLSELKQQVAGCIMATRLPQNPTNLLEEIICDADMFHLSKDDLLESSDLLRQEINMVLEKDNSLHDYLHSTLKLLKTHHYFTTFGKEKLEPYKQKNIKKLEAFFSTKK